MRLKFFKRIAPFIVFVWFVLPQSLLAQTPSFGSIPERQIYGWIAPSLPFDYAKWNARKSMRVEKWHFDPAGRSSTKSYNFGVNLLAYAPALIALRNSKNTEDLLALEIIALQLVWANGETARALKLAEDLLARAVAQGLDDKALYGLLRNVSNLNRIEGNLSKADAYAKRTLLCPHPCAQDLVFRLKQNAGKKSGDIHSVMQNRQVELAEQFINEYFPGNNTIRRKLYQFAGALIRERRPFDSLHYYQTALASVPRSNKELDNEMNARHLVIESANRNGEYALAVAEAETWEKQYKSGNAGGISTITPRSHLKILGLHARALSHLGDSRAQGIYAKAVKVAIPLIGKADSRILNLITDLLDTNFDPLKHRLLEAMRLKYPYDYKLFSIHARLLARQNKPIEAATTIATMLAVNYKKPFKDQLRALLLAQQAYYHQQGGQQDLSDTLLDQADALLQNIEKQGSPKECFFCSTPLPMIVEMRDAGNYDGAAWLANYHYANAEKSGQHSYRYAQKLWQVAYTFSRGNKQALAFNLMKVAARIAADLSFENIEATGGGSLQLLKRDRRRYLLFVDIAWASITGVKPQSMTIPSRY